MSNQDILFQHSVDLLLFTLLDMVSALAYCTSGHHMSDASLLSSICVVFVV